MGVLAASASDVAALAAMRHLAAGRHPSLYLGLALGVTFPFNLVVGSRSCISRRGRSPDRPPVTPVIGIVGGGQLARMLLPAAARLALPVRLLADPADPVAALCRDLRAGRPDADGLARLARECDVVTVEHELLPLEAVAELEREGHVFRPSSAALRVATDKAHLRRLLAAHDVPLPPWLVADQLAEVEDFAAEHGWPLVLKRPHGGYDGRGVFVTADRRAAAEVLELVGGPVLAEPELALERELAVLVARRPGGEVAVYPVVETRQVDALCREVLLPAPVPERLAAEARTLATQVAALLETVGILAVELFVSGGRLLVNEVAARPHNAGHVTIEGSVTCQFENHLRAVADLPLGATDVRAPSAMVNVIGTDGDPRHRLPAALALRDVAVHLYAKEPRPGRKLGHVTASADDAFAALDRARQAADALTGSAP